MKFPQSVMIWAAMSSATVFSEVHSKCSHLPGNVRALHDVNSDDKLYGDADFIFQQDLVPAHTAKGRLPKTGSMTMVLL